jgi:mRNA-degrading endonuclease RelE of RelBE toxin-antitoxin system
VDTDRPAKGRYAIRFSDEALDHLGAMTARQRATLLDSTERRLSHQPTLETRHRRRMQRGREGFVAPWELRVGDLRLYYEYETHEIPQRLVVVVAVGVKVRSRLRIAGKEYEP